MKKSSPDAGKSRAEFVREVKSGELAPLYLFDGPERYLRDEALRNLTARAIDPGLRDFNYVEISAAAESLDEALGLARQYPMISPRRMVVIRDFESISDEGPLEKLKDYLRQPVETSIVVFVTNGMDNRRNIATMLRKGCRVVNFESLDDQQTIQWVKEFAAQAGCPIDQAAAAALVGTVGGGLIQLSSELEKLINYVRSPADGKGGITTREVELLVRHSREHSNFELTDAIVAGDRRRSLHLLDRIYANAGESIQSLSLMILGAIAMNYRRMLIAKDLMKLNLPNSEVAQAVGMSPYAVTYLNEKARRIDGHRLLKALELLARTDLALKTSQATPRMLMEFLICELTSQSKDPTGQSGSR